MTEAHPQAELSCKNLAQPRTDALPHGQATDTDSRS